MTLLSICLELLIIVSGALWLISAYLMWRHYLQGKPVLPTGKQVPVSILIPVCGVEEVSNWHTFCQQDYPVYEVVFGVMRPDDPAVAEVRKLRDAFPDRVRLVACSEVLGPNHQVSNLIHLAREARYDRLVVTDSDMSVTPDYVSEVATPLGDEKVGIVTCGYCDDHPTSLGAALATLGRAIDFLPQVMLARALDRELRFALGATIAIRRQTLEQIGGFEAVVDRIGSDFHLGRLAREAGYEIRLSTYTLRNRSGGEAISQVFRRELRWARTIRVNRGAQFIGVGVTFGVVYALALAVSTRSPLSSPFLLFAIGTRGLQVLVSLAAIQRLSLFHWIWALPLREALSFVVWLVSLMGREVQWRGRKLLLADNGYLNNPCSQRSPHPCSATGDAIGGRLELRQEVPEFCGKHAQSNAIAQ